MPPYPSIRIAAAAPERAPPRRINYLMKKRREILLKHGDGRRQSACTSTLHDSAKVRPDGALHWLPAQQDGGASYQNFTRQNPFFG